MMSECVESIVHLGVDQLQWRGTESAGWQANLGPNPKPGAACCAVCASRVQMTQVLPNSFGEKKPCCYHSTSIQLLALSLKRHVPHWTLSIAFLFRYAGLLTFDNLPAVHVTAQVCCYLLHRQYCLRPFLPGCHW